MWATISLEHNDVIRYESTKMDYIRRSNIKEISGRERSWLDSGSSCLCTRQAIKSKRSSVIIISGSSFDRDVMFIGLEQDDGLSISSKTMGCRYRARLWVVVSRRRVVVMSQTSGCRYRARRRVVGLEQDVGLSLTISDEMSFWVQEVVKDLWRRSHNRSGSE